MVRRLSAGKAPNDLWCADFKGEFKLGNGQYCYPLTVTDHASRFLLECEALDSVREDPVIAAFEQLFYERGLLGAIRTNNGVPFASSNGLYNLSKLSVWWLRLGIGIERIKPGHPQQNGPGIRSQVAGGLYQAHSGLASRSAEERHCREDRPWSRGTMATSRLT